MTYGHLRLDRPTLQGILDFQLHIIRLSLEAVDFCDISIILDVWKATTR